jgi:hypothetical protein
MLSRLTNIYGRNHLTRGFKKDVTPLLRGLKVPVHEDLIQDYKEVLDLIQLKRQAFKQSPYSFPVFKEYIDVSSE